MATTIYKYYSVEDNRVFFDWTPNRPQEEYHGEYMMVLPDDCKVYNKDCFTYIDYNNELYDLLTDNQERPYIQIGKFKKLYFEVEAN